MDNFASVTTRQSSPGFHPLSEVDSLGDTTYRYHGFCPISGAPVWLDRTTLAESVGQTLAQGLRLKEGKMLGVLLVRDGRGRLGYGKAFSGLLDGESQQPGWAPPLHLSPPLPSEHLATLEAWKVRLGELRERLDNHPYPRMVQDWQAQRDRLAETHGAGKQRRAQDREAGARPPDQLLAESRRDSAEGRTFRQSRKAALDQPGREFRALQEALLDGQKQRRALSKGLQQEMHQQFGRSVGSLLGCSLESLFPQGVPTGTGDCCAPKLLAWAARQQMVPLAMAELWWGPTSVGDKVAGQFYPACRERCQPLMGALLAVAQRAPVRVLHIDDRFLVVDKPSGLLTVPGRYPWNQDCLLYRLQKEGWPELLAVHRLDLETSGLVVLARDAAAHADLQNQFAQRETGKIYQALLGTAPDSNQGRIDLPLAPDPARPGCYRASYDGKPASTEFRLLDPASLRMELHPITGRSHQLRVHMAQGLGAPIRGDRLYGDGGERLKLHAWRLQFNHPSEGQRMDFEAPLPF